MQASMALSSRFPRMTHRSVCATGSSGETVAFALTEMPFACAMESLLFKIASAMAFPVFITVSTVFRSSSSPSRYFLTASRSPFSASALTVWI